MNDPFPRTYDVLKAKRKELSEAEWNDKDVEKLKAEINNLERLISVGEDFIVPF
jgi:wobble nucleotide-excising tRNase